MITINKIIVDRNTPNLSGTISNYLDLYRIPLPSIKDFTLVFSKNSLSTSDETLKFHYMYTSPNKVSFINFYVIDATELILDNEQERDMLIMAHPDIMIFTDRSFYGFERKVDTQIVISSYPDEQGYSIKIMKKWKASSKTIQSCVYDNLYLVGRLFRLDYSNTGFDALTGLKKYYNIIFYHTNNSELVKNIFQSFSWTFEILLPFRVEINDIIPDDNFGLLR